MLVMPSLISFMLHRLCAWAPFYDKWFRGGGDRGRVCVLGVALVAVPLPVGDELLRSFRQLNVSHTRAPVPSPLAVRSLVRLSGTLGFESRCSHWSSFAVRSHRKLMQSVFLFGNKLERCYSL